MPISNSYLLIAVLLLIILLSYFYFLRKRNMPVKLFVEALRNENSGRFEEAVINYENALNQAKKARFRDINLENRIIEKLKVLHTIIEYKNGLRITRKHTTLA
jgi:hypothetical protein